jgi:hypothetical protein
MPSELHEDATDTVTKQEREQGMQAAAKAGGGRLEVGEREDQANTRHAAWSKKRRRAAAAGQS